MSAPLEDWQGRLERHFESLAAARAASGFPIFVLEHGLSQPELDDLFQALRARFAANEPLAPHWLLWAIFATERGYGYAGDVYWGSFEELMPDWHLSDRPKLISWFSRFADTYPCVVPTGLWAEHFRIIAWPITHAILPTYLQRQFARLLYDLRYDLAGLSTLEPSAIGRLLSANAVNASTRFEAFLEQEELSGRIVLALLGDFRSDSEGPIYSKTLERIVGDLRQVRNAREWLDEARAVANDRFKGICRGAASANPRASPRSESTAISDHSVQPRLALRYSGADEWTLTLEVPSFRKLAALNSDIQAYLRRTRCRFNGSDEPRPAGWLLSAPRRVVLKAWPNPAEPLIRFEQGHPIVDQLLEADCRLSKGHNWLFKVGSDGLAREVLSRAVRPGEDYILLATEDLPDPRAWVRPCSVSFGGVHAHRMRIPGSSLTSEEIRWLHDLGLRVVRTIRVWPAGLPGRRWDGEGFSEWLTTEAPRLGILHDHPVASLGLRLNRGPEAIIASPPAGHPTFVQLAPLSPGLHSLSVRAVRHSSLRDISSSGAVDGHLQLLVREPDPWTPGVSSHSGLIVSVEPHDADLDDLWRNNIDLSVVGPEGRSIAISLTLEDRNGGKLASVEVSRKMNLPVTADTWRKQFARVLRGANNWAYLAASAGHLTLCADELGEYRHRFHHLPLPLRWISDRRGDQVFVRLIDETGEESEPEVTYFPMDHPLRSDRVSPETAQTGFAIQPPGGLFSARHGPHSDRAIVSAGLTTEGFAGLSAHPSFSELAQDAASLFRSLQLFADWASARVSGFLAHTRHQEVCEAFLSAIYGAVCGAAWTHAERAFRVSRAGEPELDTLKRLVSQRPAFAFVLQRDYRSIHGDLRSDTVTWFAELAGRYKACSNPGLAEFALRIASQPAQVARLRAADGEAMLGALVEHPDLLRGARFLALLCAKDDNPAAIPNLPRWTW